MCALCSEEMVSRLRSWTNIRTAGLELLLTLSEESEQQHIMDRLDELEKRLASKGITND